MQSVRLGIEVWYSFEFWLFIDATFQFLSLFFCLSLCLSVCPYACLSVLPVCPSVWLSLCLPVLMPVCPYAGLSLCRPVLMSACMYVLMSVDVLMFVCHLACLYFNLSPSLSLSLYIYIYLYYCFSVSLCFFTYISFYPTFTYYMKTLCLTFMWNLYSLVSISVPVLCCDPT